MSGNQPLGGNSDGGVIANAGEPVHGRLFAEPSELALGVAAFGLLNRFCGGSQSDGAFAARPQLAVPDEVERRGVKCRCAQASRDRALCERAARRHRRAHRGEVAGRS